MKAYRAHVAPGDGDYRMPFQAGGLATIINHRGREYVLLDTALLWAVLILGAVGAWLCGYVFS